MSKHLILSLLCLVLHLTANAQSIATTDSYLAHIRKYGQEPMKYIADKIRTYSVVAIGEDHWIKEHPLFLCDIIRTMAKDTTARCAYACTNPGVASRQLLL